MDVSILLSNALLSILSIINMGLIGSMLAWLHGPRSMFPRWSACGESDLARPEVGIQDTDTLLTGTFRRSIRVRANVEDLWSWRRENLYCWVLRDRTGTPMARPESSVHLRRRFRLCDWLFRVVRSLEARQAAQPGLFAPTTSPRLH